MFPNSIENDSASLEKNGSDLMESQNMESKIQSNERMGLEVVANFCWPNQESKSRRVHDKYE